MSALPIEPTERDRERFRDITKAMGYPLEYARCGQHEAYSDAITHMVFEVWWKAERERQLLQNLNMSQGVKLSQLAQKLEKAQMEIEALSTENGFVHQHAEEDKQELREQLEAERKRLDWALKYEAVFYEWNGEMFIASEYRDKYGANTFPALNPRTTIDELIAGEQK